LRRIKSFTFQKYHSSRYKTWKYRFIISTFKTMRFRMEC